MKKNAFTIVELLTTVVILGVIMGVAVVSYNRYIETSKKKTYEDAEITMKAASESYLTYCSTSPFSSSDCIVVPNVGETTTIELSTLIQGGFMDPIADQKTNDYCSGNIRVTNKGMEENYNLEYNVCLICSDYKSKDCSEK